MFKSFCEPLVVNYEFRAPSQVPSWGPTFLLQTNRAAGLLRVAEGPRRGGFFFFRRHSFIYYYYYGMRRGGAESAHACVGSCYSHYYYYYYVATAVAVAVSTYTYT